MRAKRSNTDLGHRKLLLPGDRDHHAKAGTAADNPTEGPQCPRDRARNRQNLADTFRAKVIRRYEGTRIAQQELMAEILRDVRGAYGRPTSSTRRACGRARRAYTSSWPSIRKRGLDRDNSEDDDGAETDIVVAGLGEDSHGYVLEDATTRGAPADWATAAIRAFVRTA